LLKLLHEYIGVMFGQQVRNDEIVGYVVGHEIGAVELEGDCALLRRFELAFDRRLLDAEDSETRGAILGPSPLPGLFSLRTFLAVTALAEFSGRIGSVAIHIVVRTAVDSAT